MYHRSMLLREVSEEKELEMSFLRTSDIAYHNKCDTREWGVPAKFNSQVQVKVKCVLILLQFVFI